MKEGRNEGTKEARMPKLNIAQALGFMLGLQQ